MNRIGLHTYGMEPFLNDRYTLIDALQLERCGAQRVL